MWGWNESGQLGLPSQALRKAQQQSGLQAGWSFFLKMVFSLISSHVDIVILVIFGQVFVHDISIANTIEVNDILFVVLAEF